MDNDKKTNNEVDSGPNVAQSIIHEYSAEFRRIVWPSKQILFKHTVTVIAVSLMFGAYIALMDGVFGYGLRQFIQLDFIQRLIMGVS